MLKNYLKGNVQKLRYRAFENDKVIDVMSDRPAFHERLHKGNPNNPLGGIIVIEKQTYQIIDYKEFHSSSFSENEFHEKDQDWFAHVFVNKI